MENSDIRLVSEADFEAEVLKSPLPVLVDFGAEWCGPCRALEPILEGIASKHAGALRVVKVDGDASPELTAKYRVRGFPTVIAFVGGVERARHTGTTNAAKLIALADVA
jgi:thioredoxin 1